MSNLWAVRVIKILFFLISVSMHAQPMLESGKTIGSGDEYLELSILGYPVQPNSSWQYSQSQLQKQIGICDKWEVRYAFATGQSSERFHLSILAGMQYLIHEEGNWSGSLSATVSYLRGDQIIPQNKFWYSASHISKRNIELNINLGFCQNTFNDPFQPLIAAGWIIPASKSEFIHLEIYLQPGGNSALQIGYDFSKNNHQTLFMIAYNPQGPPAFSLVRSL